MPRKKPKTVFFRRKREGKTNYKKRLHLLLAKKPRFVVHFTNQKVIAQLIDFKTAGDLVLVGIDSSALKKYGWNFAGQNTPAAYLTGLLLGKLALQKNIKTAILDIGFKSPIKGNKIYACLKGALDAGLAIPHSPEILPAPERISGQHIQNYAQQLKSNPELYQRKFSKYLKNNLDPEKIVEVFQNTKQKIENA